MQMASPERWASPAPARRASTLARVYTGCLRHPMTKVDSCQCPRPGHEASHMQSCVTKLEASDSCMLNPCQAKQVEMLVSSDQVPTILKISSYHVKSCGPEPDSVGTYVPRFSDTRPDCTPREGRTALRAAVQIETIARKMSGPSGRHQSGAGIAEQWTSISGSWQSGPSPNSRQLSYTGFLRLTPHHSTGAKFVAQSNVKRLMSQRTARTGIGASRTSVRLRNGNAL